MTIKDIATLGVFVPAIFRSFPTLLFVLYEILCPFRFVWRKFLLIRLKEVSLGTFLAVSIC